MSGSAKLMTSGGGGLVLTPASSVASDVTVNVPSQNCTLDIQGPAFSGYLATNQSITSGVWTKVTINTEEFDTNSCFDSATNYRFTPNVAGYYQVNAGINTATASTQSNISIYKNGSSFKSAQQIGTYAGSVVSSVVYLNGSTDYIELYGILVGVTPSFAGGAASVFFSAALVRGA
jgi:hypothetical protein